MANANQFQPSRPTPIYSPTINAMNNRRPGWGVGLLDMASTVQQMLGLDPTSQYNKTLTQTQRDAQLRNAYAELEKIADPEARLQRLKALTQNNPELAKAFEGVDVTNIKDSDLPTREHTRNLLRMRDGYEQIRGFNNQTPESTGDPQMAPLVQQVPQDQQGGIAELLTEPPVQEGFQTGVLPDGQSAPLTPPPGQSGVMPDGVNTQEVMPPVVGEGHPEGAVNAPAPADPRVELIKQASQHSGYPEHELHVSPNTGDVKLRPETAPQYPQLPISAFVDIPLAGPEDPVIKQTMQTHMPTIIDTQRNMIRDGHAVRFWRSAALGQQPDMTDIMAMTMANADIDLMRTELAAKLGVINPDDISVQDMENFAIWANPTADPDMRKAPEVLASVGRVLAAPPTLQKVMLEGAQFMVDKDLDWVKFNGIQQRHAAEMAWRNYDTGVKATHYANQDAVAETNAETNKLRAQAAKTSAWAAAVQAGVDMTSEERRRAYLARVDEIETQAKKNRASASIEEMKKQEAELGYDPEYLEIVLREMGKDAAALNTQVSGLQTLVKNTQYGMDQAKDRKASLLKNLPNQFEMMFMQSSSLKPPGPEATEEERKAYIDFTSNSQYEQVRNELAKIDKEIYGDPADPNSRGYMHFLNDARTRLDSAMGELEASIKQTPAEKRERVINQMYIVDPDKAAIHQKFHKVHISPNPKAAKAVFTILDYTFQDGLSSAQAAGYVDANGNFLVKPADIGPLMLEGVASNQALQQALARAGITSLQVSPQDIERALEDWVQIEVNRDRFKR